MTVRLRILLFRFNGAALFRARKFCVVIYELVEFYASMGPRFLGRGNALGMFFPGVAGLLQWGRAF